MACKVEHQIVWCHGIIHALPSCLMNLECPLLQLVLFPVLVVLSYSLLQHMMDSLQKRMGGSSAGGLPSGLSALTGSGGGLAGAAVGLMASFLLGGGAMGGQVPVVCCDKQVDLYSTRLGI